MLFPFHGFPMFLQKIYACLHNKSFFTQVLTVNQESLTGFK